MPEDPQPIAEGLRELIRRFDDLAGRRQTHPRVYLVGAGSLLLEGLLSRGTTDLGFICDDEGKLFENQMLPEGTPRP